MHREKPDSADEMLNQLWYAIIGTNGEGMLTRQHVLEEKFNEYISKDRKESCYYLADKEEGRSRNAKLRDMVKFGISEGIKIGAALGIFTWLRGQF